MSAIWSSQATLPPFYSPVSIQTTPTFTTPPTAFPPSTTPPKPSPLSSPALSASLSDPPKTSPITSDDDDTHWLHAAAATALASAFDTLPASDHPQQFSPWSPPYLRLNSPPPFSLAPSQQQLSPPPSPYLQPFQKQPPPPHPTRSVILRNLPPGIDDATIRLTLEAFGPLRDLGAQLRARGARGSVRATFYDLRHAKRCVQTLHGAVKWDRRLDARFCAGGEHENQGTLVVFNLDVNTSAEDVRRLFGVYGDVKEIRETPNKRFHKFVEFFDVRDAMRAMKGLNKMEVNGKRIKIEISRPGGRGCASPQRRSMERNMTPGFPASPDRVHAKFVLDIGKVKRGEDGRTALMIRNIPNKYNQKMLVAALDEEFRGKFDFLYLPIDFKNKCNVGYAFINFMDPKYIPHFYEEFDGKKWGRFNSEKVCCITYARIQGKANLIAHFQNSSLMNEDPKCQPVVFDAMGRREEFPVGCHVRTRRGPSVREARSLENSPHCSPRAHHHYHHHHHHHHHGR